VDLNFAGRMSSVTGGSKGIGFACAAAFAAEGRARGDLLAQSRHPCRREQGRSRKRVHEVLTVAADLVDPKSAPELVAEVERRLGPVEVLVNCAGAAKRYAPADLDMQAWHSAMDSKYFTYVHAMQAVLHGDGGAKARRHRQYRRSGRQVAIRATSPEDRQTPR